MKVFIGGAWPYANNSLHIGHLAALLPGDIIARYYRKKGSDVIYVSGTDSHGTPITQRAKKENKDPNDIAMFYHKEFVESFNKLNFSYDFYTNTIEEYHKKNVKEYFLKIIENGYTYEKEEEQDYCSKCDEFLSDREVIGICPHCGGSSKGDQCDECLSTLNAIDLTEKKCSICNNLTIYKKNKHLYFKLSEFQKDIEKLLGQRLNTWRLNAINETKKYLKNGLHDRAITRQLDWGVDVPISGFEDKKIYVWFEAVLGYLTASKKVLEERKESFDNYFKNNMNLISYYIHGKDNIPFHTIIYPSILLAIDKNFNLPNYILSSNYINFDGEKISKSKGNGVTIPELLSRYESDTIRFYTLLNNPESKDSNYSEEHLIQNHNKHLVGEYGNFINRNLAFIVKKFDGIINTGKLDQKVINTIKNTYKIVGDYIEKGEMRNAITSAFSLVQFSNKYYDDNKPWEKAKTDEEEFKNITYNCAVLIINIANILEPFIPNSSKKVRKILNIIVHNNWEYIEIKDNIKIENIDVLFNRIEY